MPVHNRGDEPVEDDVLIKPSGVPPVNVGTTNPGPAASSFAPPDEEPQAVTDEADLPDEAERAEDGGQSQEPSLPKTFDPRYMQAFEGLMYLGCLTKEFRYLGHDFTIRSLNVDEVIEVGLICKPYVGGLSEMKAYQAAVTAACLVSVDGQPPPTPITNRPDDTMLRNRFRWVRHNFFPPVLDEVYSRYLTLEVEVAEVMAHMGESQG